MAKSKAAAKPDGKALKVQQKAVKAETKKKVVAPPPSSSDEESSEEESEEEAPKVVPQTKGKAQPVKAAAKAESSSEEDSDDESSEEEPAPAKPAAKANGTAKPAANGAAKKAAAKEESSEDESSDEESSEEEVPVAKAAPPKGVASKKSLSLAEKESSDEESSDEESSEEEEAPKPAAKAAAKAAPAAKAAAKKVESEEESSEEESSEEEEAPKPAAKAAAPAKAAAKKEESEEESDEESSDEEMEEAEEAPKAPPAKKARVEAAAPATPVAAGAGESSTVFLGNLPWSATEDSIKAFFKGTAKVTAVRIRLDENGRSRGFAHVDFATPADAVKATSLAGTDMEGRAVKVEVAQPRAQQNSFGADQSAETTSIFIKGFDTNQSEDDIKGALQEAFEKCGPITSIRLPTDRETGAIKGICYLEFATNEAKAASAELDGSEIAGGYLKVDLNVRPRPPREEGGFGGGRGGFGGGRGGGGFRGGRGGDRGGRGGGRGFGGRDGGRGGRGGGRGGRGGMSIAVGSSSGKRQTFDD